MSTIRTVDRAFTIVQIVAQNPDGIGVNAIAAQLDLAKSTVSRLLATMQQREIVEQMADRRYRIGAEPLRWVSYQPQRATLSALARPVLQELVAQTGEAAAVCVESGGEVLYLDNVQSQQDIQIRDWTGEALPLHVVAPGKILLAHCEPEFVDQYLQSPLTKLTVKTVVDPDELRSQITEIRRKGHAVTEEEFAAEIIGMAAPVRDADQTVIASICVYGPKFRLGTKSVQRACIGHLKTAVEKLSIPA